MNFDKYYDKLKEYQEKNKIIIHNKCKLLYVENMGILILD
jgi:hypothetical protein